MANFLVKKVNCPVCLFCFDSPEHLAAHLQERAAAKDGLHEKYFISNSACLIIPGTSLSDIATGQTKGIKLRRHQCNQCKKAFVRPSELFRHYLTHTGEKSFKCKQCNRSFLLKHHLEDHAKTHKPASHAEKIQCSVCGKNFLSNSALKLHIRMHTNEMPFSCEEVTCAERFRTKKMMYAHLRNAHLNPLKEPSTKQNFAKTSTSTCHGVLHSLNSITQIERSTLKASANSAFTLVSQALQNTTLDDRLDADSLIQTQQFISREMVVIRVQLRSGSVVAGSSNSNLVINIVLDPISLSQLAVQGHLMHIPLKKLSLQLNLMLSLDPGAVLNRLKMQSSNINSSGSAQTCFTSVVYPTVQHVLTQPPLPFSIISVRKEDEVKILKSHMPSFLIECFLAPTQNGSGAKQHYDPQSRQSCLPMLYNVPSPHQQLSSKKEIILLFHPFAKMRLSSLLLALFVLATFSPSSELTEKRGITTNDTTADSNVTKAPLIEPEASQKEEKKESLAIFFILLIIVLSILLVHVLIITEFHYMPESLAIVLLGALIGLGLSYSKWDWREVETLNPNFFFLVILPPIIFESGYNLHKGNFFANIIPILMFSIVGTAISAFVMGFSLYVLGQAGLIYHLSAIESFAFGSMISAVDPVITLAIFQALKVDVQLYMLAFGESMLNDAVAIVLASTAMEMNNPAVANLGSLDTLQYAFVRFLVMFFVSAALGSFIGSFRPCYSNMLT
uniref:Sodium/hydrogen exchanger 8 n=1 Tax=Ditylenchus dipsaci TaxID=166011 RepID=A0A915CXU8_9BILA